MRLVLVAAVVLRMSLAFVATPLTEKRRRLSAVDDERNSKFFGDEPVRASRPMRRSWRKALESANNKKKKVSQASEANEKRPQLLKIVGGEARGRRLESPPTMLRPMMSKVREAMFSMLFSLGSFRAGQRLRVLDCFCGSGAVGCEALSRGAAFAAFVDISETACASAERNAKRCGYDETRAASVCETAESALSRQSLCGGLKFDVLSLTPPYEEVTYSALLDAVANSKILNDDAIVVVEYPVELGLLPKTHGDQRQLVGLRNRRYGRTVLAFYAFRPTGAQPFQFKLEEFDSF